MTLPKTHILIVDDKSEVRESLKAIFSSRHELSLASSVTKARHFLKQHHVNLVLLDIIMPGEDGLQLLTEIKASHPYIPVIMLTAVTTTSQVVEAMRLGAYDYIAKPFDLEEIRLLVHRALEDCAVQRKLVTLQSEVAGEFPVNSIIGQSPKLLRCLEETRKTATANSTLLIGGESGTGKELTARLLHDLSPRSKEPFVAIHCAALPESLAESELFGYEKGAFTHAEERKIGRFELAGSGTLFFDEVGEISLTTQVKLLRVLQEREFRRVGGSQLIRFNATVVAATAKNLKAEVDAGTFRNDLYYRINVVPITLPPLRERSEDIPLLAHHFLEYFRQKMTIKTREFEAEALIALQSYHWPGNVRELRNTIERILVLHSDSAVMRMEFLPPEIVEKSVENSSNNGESRSLADVVNVNERRMIEQALRETAGNQSRAAKLLGTTRRKLKYRMDKLGIESN